MGISFTHTDDDDNNDSNTYKSFIIDKPIGPLAQILVMRFSFVILGS
jgi:hypothetical protein